MAIVGCGKDGFSRIWDIKNTINKNEDMANEIKCVMFNPAETEVCFGYGGKGKNVGCYNFDIDSNNIFQKYITKSEKNYIEKINFDDYGKTLFSISKNLMKVWNNDNGEFIENVEGSWKYILDTVYNENQKSINILHSKQNEISMEYYIMGDNRFCQQTNNLLNEIRNNRQMREVSDDTNKMKIENDYDFDYNNKDYKRSKTSNENSEDYNVINELNKKHESFSKIVTQKIDFILPIVGWWGEGNIQNVITNVSRLSQPLILVDLLNFIMNTNKIQNMSPDFASIFIKKCKILLEGDYLQPARVGIKFLSEIYKNFSNDIINIKSVNLMTKVDLQREERVKKFEILLNELIEISKNKRIQKLLQKLNNDEHGVLLERFVADISFLNSKCNN